MVVCGDLTQTGKQSEFDAASDWLNALKLPFFSVPGNHDTPLLNLVSRVMSPFKRYSQSFGDHAMTDQLGDVRVHGLNTSRGWQVRANWAEGSVDLDDLQEIVGEDARLMAVQENALPGCLVCHHPFRSPPGAPLQTRTRRGSRASKMLADSTINLLLCGHVHTPTDNIWQGEHGNYLCLTSGTLSTRQRQAPPGFNVLDFGDNTLKLDQYIIDNNEFCLESSKKWRLNDLELLSA